MDMDSSMVVVGEGWREAEESVGGINGEGRRRDLGR